MQLSSVELTISHVTCDIALLWNVIINKVYNGFVTFPSLLEALGIRVPVRNI
jgi:hypothetical protein